MLNWLGKILSGFKPNIILTAVISTLELCPALSVLTKMLFV